MFKICLPGSEKSESSSAKFAAPSPLPEPTAITKTGTNVKTNACTETSPKIYRRIDRVAVNGESPASNYGDAVDWQEV